jgi:hypothetical protein
MSRQILLFIVVLLLMLGHASAQDKVDVDALDQKLQRHLQTKMPGWQYERIEPIQGSKGVLIQKWTTSNRGVRIVVTRSKTAAEAKAHIENFMKEVKGEPLRGFGDDAFVWGFEESDLEVRRGRYIFDLNAGADVLRDPDALSITSTERHARAKAEVRRIIREFAKHVVDAVDSP